MRKIAHLLEDSPNLMKRRLHSSNKHKKYLIFENEGGLSCLKSQKLIKEGLF